MYRRFGELLDLPMRSGVTVPAAQRGSGVKMLNMGELFRYPRIPAVKMARVNIDVSDAGRYLLAEGDLMFARRSLTLEGAGKCSIIAEIDEPTTWESSIIRARLDSSIADPSYYFYYFASPQGRRSVEAIVEQVAVAGVRLTELARLQVPAPPLADQRAIAEVLGALDDEIAANSELVKNADELARAITDASVDRTLTEPLCDAASVTMGSSPSGATFNEHGVGIPFFQGTRDFGVRYPKRRMWTTDPTRVAQAGDCLFSVRAPVGVINMASEELCIGRGLASLRSVRGRPYSLFHILSLSSDAWAGFQAEGTIFGSINRQQLSALSIFTVPEPEVARLEARTEALELRIRAALDESEAAATLRDLLLPHLMSGRLRVRDAEKQVAEVI